MVDETRLATIEQQLNTYSSSHRQFFIPLVRAIATLGGRARKQEVIKQVRTSLKDKLRPRQLDYLENKRRFSRTRRDLRRAGLIAGSHGIWELTDLGHAYAQAHAEDELEISSDIPDATTLAASRVDSETVAATASAGYELPLLKVMTDGVTDKDEIFERLHAALQSSFLPGDRRTTRRGKTLWQDRAYWALSSLKRSGDVEHLGTGQWAITSSGRERLARERDSWSLGAYQRSQAKVRVEGGEASATPAAQSGPSEETWENLRADLPDSLFDDLTARFRPDLGPSPDQRIARNLILYGPPGTGKTHIAKAIAEALTGQAPGHADEDDRARLVQFHPSYAYEDFVQGLRPDLKETGLRYALQQGPFLRIARDAEQDPDAFYVLIIDEINRGDPARIFGELMYALEYRDEPITLALGGELVVPSNLVIIGTMNSVDRSVALVDYALRRRFGFLRVDPNPDVIATVRDDGLLAQAGPAVLEKFNEWLRKRLDGEHVLGHSYFLTNAIADDAEDAFEQLWRLDIRPLLEEYFFGDEDGLRSATEAWHRITGQLE
ncbi:MAG: hypothetical protein Tsb0020_19520 [Haliangiales bacterium]